jgi:hypothetical protein
MYKKLAQARHCGCTDAGVACLFEAVMTAGRNAIEMLHGMARRADRGPAAPAVLGGDLRDPFADHVHQLLKASRGEHGD